MAGTTISGSYTTGITLSNAATQNPATVTGTGHINVTSASSSGIYGTNATAWSIYNFGTVIAYARGVFLNSGGTITNAAAGLIRSNYRGIEIGGGLGAVTNAGSIGGSKQQGIRLTGGGSVTNASSGVISAGGTYAAIVIQHGGSVDNAAGGVVAAGVQIYDLTGTVTNAGSINTGKASGGGIQLFAGGSVSNAGVIDGARYGIQSQGPASITNSANAVIDAGTATGAIGVYLSTGPVSNAGTIRGEIAISFGHGGIVSNLADGVLSAPQYSGGAGILFGAGLGTLMNAGMITAFSGATLSAGGVVTNKAGAVIATGQQDIRALGVATTVVNYGTMTSQSQNYVYNGSFSRQLPAIELDAGGSVSNTGIVIAGPGAAAIGISGGSGTVSNTGTVYGRVIIGDGSVSNAVSGTIEGVSATGMASVFNAGYLRGVGMHAGGTLINEPGGSIKALSDGVVIDNPATTVVNRGSIASLVYYGVAIAGANLSNASTGTIVGLKKGLVSAGATIHNAGLIASSGGSVLSRTGIDLSNGGTVINEPSGTIAGRATGSGPSYGVYAGGTGANANVFNEGVISGALGVYFGTNGDTVTNAGTIASTSASGTAVHFWAAICSWSIRMPCSSAMSMAAPPVQPSSWQLVLVVLARWLASVPVSSTSALWRSTPERPGRSAGTKRG